MAERTDEETKEILARARKQYDEGEAAMSDLKEGSVDDIKFGRLGDQWPQDAKADREAEGRPCLTINDIPATIRQVVNDARQNRPQIKVRPVDSGADVLTAEVFAGIIKNIETISDADVAYDTGLERAADARVGYIWVDLDFAGDDTFDLDIKIRPVPNPQAVTRDANTQAVDSSDWNYAFICEMMSKEAFKEKYPDYDYDAVDFAEDGNLRTWIEKDQIRLANWYERIEKPRTLLLLSDNTIVDAETYEEKKAVFDEASLTVLKERTVPSYEIVHRLITGCDILDEKRWRGSIIPIIPVYGEMINEEGKWHYKSMVTDAKDAQRMFNLARSTLSEMVGRSPKTPFMGPAGIFDVDKDKWDSVNTRLYSRIEYDGKIAMENGGQFPQRVPQPGLPEGLMQDIMAAADDKKRIMSVHDARMGLPGEELSGRAIRYRQHQSDVATFHLTDNLNRAIRAVGRVCIELIPQVYTGERVARIIGTDGKAKTVKLGPLPKDPATGQPIRPPDQTGIEKIYDPTVGKYDLAVEAGPSYATRRQESAEMITSYIQAAPQAAGILGPVLVKLSDMPDGEKISNMLATLMPPAARQVWDGTPMPQGPQVPPEVQAQQAKAQADLEIEKQKAAFTAGLEKQKHDDALAREREKWALEKNLMLERAQVERQIMLDKAEAEKQANALKLAAAVVREPGPSGLAPNQVPVGA
jgi:hypothetical protein